jgi:hypothetical protein
MYCLVSFDKLYNKIRDINDDINIEHEINHLKAGIVPMVKDYAISNAMVFQVNKGKDSNVDVEIPVTIFCSEHKPIHETATKMGDSAHDIMLFAVMPSDKCHKDCEGNIIALSPMLSVALCKLSDAVQFTPAALPPIKAD